MIVNEQVAIDHGLKKDEYAKICELLDSCLLYTSPSPRDKGESRMPSSA